MEYDNHDTGGQMKKRSVWKKLGFSLLAFAIFFGVLEVALRLSGFEVLNQQVELHIAGQKDATTFTADDESMWLPKPSQGNFNRATFIGPDIAVARSSGVPRVALLGDSCTELGTPPYSKFLSERLATSIGKPVEVLNAGIIGYTTYQGIRRFERDVLPYRPDIVTIYFGWNDHWMWRSMTDAELYRKRSVAAVRIHQMLRSSRIVQGVELMVDYVKKMQGSETNLVFRVPIEEYRANLQTLVSRIRAGGAVPVLITAPTDITASTAKDEFERLKELSLTVYASPKELHDAYVAVTRKIAAENGVLLIDAYSDFAGQPGLIMKDHIHLTPVGIERLANLIHQAILPLVQRLSTSPK